MKFPISSHAKSLVAIVCLSTFFGCSDSNNNNAQQGMPPLPVSTYTVVAKNVPISLEYPAQIKSIKQVHVTARVAGTLEKILYTEGEFVKKGTPLYKIDQTRYRASYDGAVAGLATAEAMHKEATRNYERIEKLVKSNAVSQRDYDAALSLYESTKAGLQSAQAAVTRAKVDLDYTNIEATISGVTSLNSVDIGSYVGTSAENSLLTTITQLDPIYVEFSIPDKELMNKADILKNNPKIYTTITTPDGKEYEHNGTLDFIDKVIDPQTATVKARASFKNPNNKLLPGLFVRVSINGLEEENTFTVPQRALMQDGVSMYVYVVDAKSEAKKLPIKVGASTRDGSSIVTSGLSGGEIIILDNLTKIKPESKVVPKSQAQVTPMPMKEI